MARLMAQSNLVLGSKYCHPGAVVLRELFYLLRAVADVQFAMKTGRPVLLR
jgi:hypothetical protein